MTPDINTSTSAVEKMNSFTAAWDTAPAVANKDALVKHYQAVEISQRVMNGAQTKRQLDDTSVTRPPFARKQTISKKEVGKCSTIKI